ncbi:winged helix-turn-helix transcriptional regulator [Ligilactobacillus murinus]
MYAKIGDRLITQMRKTEYSLTELGNSIVSLVVALCDRGEQYLDN